MKVLRMRFDLAYAVIWGRGKLFASAAAESPARGRATLPESSGRITSMEGLRAFLSRGGIPPGGMITGGMIA